LRAFLTQQPWIFTKNTAVNPLPTAPKVIRARAREFQPPRAAVEQAQTECVFQRGNAARQGGLWHAELGGGAAESVGLGDFYKQGHFV
jgi:hypothetical protein